MKPEERNFYLIILAIAGFLLWNYPLVSSVMSTSAVWKKMMYFFGSWLVIVWITRKLTKSKTSE